MGWRTIKGVRGDKRIHEVPFSQQDKTFKLYVSADSQTIGLALMQEFEGKERVVFYLSRRLLDPETRYSPIEKLCLCLYFSCTKLWHYFLSAECTVVSKADVIKHMLSMPILNGRMGKWILALSEFDLRYESAKAVKGQGIADFVTQHHKPKHESYGAGALDVVFRWVIM